MKKIILAAFVVSLFSGCFIFQKKEKYGCPTNGRNIGAEKLAAGDPAAMKANKKAKFKGGKSY
jgi:hypothetical protein